MMTTARRAYADTTTIAVRKTRTEIISLLESFGIERHAVMIESQETTILFTLNERDIKIIVPRPSIDDPAVTTYPSGRYRPWDQRDKARAQVERARWRLILLLTRAKLEAIAAGAIDVETAFLAEILALDGKTVGEQVLPQLRAKSSVPLLTTSNRT